MSVYRMKLPDVGEGVAEAELIAWMVAVGDHVTPDTVIAEVLTDKATVEVSAPVAGEVVALHGEPGDVLAVGGELIGIETGESPPDTEPDTELAADAEAEAPPESDDDADEDTTRSDEQEGDGRARDDDTEPAPDDSGPPPAPTPAPWSAPAERPSADRPTAAPAVRARAGDLGLDLATIAGSGPDGRVVHADLDRELLASAGSGTRPGSGAAGPSRSEGRHDVPVRGVRRRIAERMSAAWNDIPHITYVDDVDVTELERLRSELNAEAGPDGERLTILPFLARAMVLALVDQPGINAHYDHSTETLTTFDAVHIGVATQTDDGLRVPVVRHAEGRGVRALGAEIGRITAAARDRSATARELSGSTITITSLGALGGLVTTPIINPPEVAIVGVNKMETRPVWRDDMFQPRKVLNLSSSFDHRMVDGWDAAVFVQRIKRLLETPALLFVTDD